MDMSNFDLSSYLVDSGGIPQAYYIPEFISEEEEAYLLRQIYNAPKPKWKNLENRRLQVWGGDLTTSNKLLAQPLPPFLNKYPDIIQRLKSTGVFSSSKHGAPNHVIINEYLPLQGIMPHEDGPSYHPVVATISLCSHTVFHYYRYKPDDVPASPPERDGTMSGTNGSVDSQTEKHARSNGPSKNHRGNGRIIDMSRPALSLLLEPRSLVITTRELYTDHLHGIDPLAEDVFLPTSSQNISDLDAAPDRDRSRTTETGVRVANRSMVKDTKLRELVTTGGTLKREARISLTCRDVESAVNMKSLR